ncbi:MAG: ATP-dependent helicase [Planctomycetota bacterium]|nr:MAG: ATP-dependent helicase [Planctomycetota bacterium]
MDKPSVESWQPDFSLSTTTVALPSLVQPALETPWPADVLRSQPSVYSLPLGSNLAAAVSLKIAPPKLKIESYRFGMPSAWRAPAQATPAEVAASPCPPKTRTRIEPPSDVVKLEDRLFYLLQPSLEALIGDCSLSFPAHPFGYQFEGIAFLYPRYAAVLADEMGLGKTMQAITAVRLLLHAGELSTVLLVCPKPLVTNWQREFAHWAAEVPTVAIEGDRTRRRWQWEQDDVPVKIANYELLQRDRKVIAELGLHFDLVVLDEAQRIKNRSSATSQCVRSIPRRRGWALTGTPVENSPRDLVGIFEFLSPGYLHDEMKPRKMGKAAADFICRRTKDKVLTELPPKMFRDAEVELTSSQRASYELAEKEGVVRLTEMGDEATIQHVFELVLRLKQICNFDPASGESSKFERLAADINEVAASGRKALVFSQWVATLETLAARLKRARPLLYHGKIPPAKRDGILDEFRNDPKRHVMLLSYGAGGTGLNLQCSEYVFLYDRWWNPAVEDQAINRAHRIGAAGPVTVTRFLALETIEQRIDQILREKREIFDTIFTDAEPTQHTGLTQKEVFGLFQLRCPNGPIDVAA